MRSGHRLAREGARGTCTPGIENTRKFVQFAGLTGLDVTRIMHKNTLDYQ